MYVSVQDAGMLHSPVFVRPTFQSLTKMTSWFLQKNISAAFFFAPDFLFDILFWRGCCFEYFKNKPPATKEIPKTATAALMQSKKITNRLLEEHQTAAND